MKPLRTALRRATTLKDHELPVLKALSLGTKGRMTTWLRDRTASDWVILGRAGRKVVGWGMLRPRGTIEAGGITCCFFVDQNYRRQGIGTYLYAQLKRKAEALGVPFVPKGHDVKSRTFFKKVA